MRPSCRQVRALLFTLRNEPHSIKGSLNLLTEILLFASEEADLISWAVECGFLESDIKPIQRLLREFLEEKNYAFVGALASLLTLLRRGYPAIENGKYSIPKPPMFPPHGFVSKAKIEHDLEQLLYLQDRRLITGEVEAHIASYGEALQCVSQLDKSEKAAWDQYPFSKLDRINNRLVSYRNTAKVKKALSSNWSPPEAEKEYLDSPQGVIVIDDFLSKESLIELRQFCLESTLWFGNRYQYGRLSAFLSDGFCSPLILQIVEELEESMPQVFRHDLPLRELWAFKSGPEIPPDVTNHADDAVLNVNFWITDDDSNLDPCSGGLKIFNIQAPSNWGFDSYNGNQNRIRRFISENGASEAIIPYKANRAVIFNSNLFHALDRVTFKPGYLNKRVNVTMLFGDRIESPKRE